MVGPGPAGNGQPRGARRDRRPEVAV